MTVLSTDVVPGENGSAPQFNNLRGDFILGKNVGGIDTYGTTIAIDWSDKTKGKLREITLTGNPTLTFSNAVKDQAIGIRFVQDGSGGRTPTLPTCKLPSGATPTFSTTPYGVDLLIFVCTAISPTPVYECYFGGFDLQ